MISILERFIPEHAFRRNAPRAIAACLALLMALPLSSCGQGRADIPGIDRFTVNILQRRLYVSFVATELRWDTGITLPIPGLADSSVSVAPDISSEGTVFQFAIPLASILPDGTSFAYSGLPDGRPLPDVVGGELPRRDFRIRNVDVSLYLSNDAFALFVPIKLGNAGKVLTSLVSISIEDEHGNRLGKVYAVPGNVSGNGSGVFVLLPLVTGRVPT